MSNELELRIGCRCNGSVLATANRRGDRIGPTPLNDQQRAVENQKHTIPSPAAPCNEALRTSFLEKSRARIAPVATQTTRHKEKP